MITSEGECIIGYFEKGAPSGLVIYNDISYTRVFEGVVVNSPMTLINSCQPFMNDETRVTKIEPFDETKDCTQLELRFEMKVADFS